MGKLTQRERVLVLKHKAVAKELKGQLTLTAGVFNSVSEWKPTNREDVTEYNKYIDVSNFHLEIKLQVQLIHHTSMLCIGLQLEPSDILK